MKENCLKLLLRYKIPTQCSEQCLICTVTSPVKKKHFNNIKSRTAYFKFFKYFCTQLYRCVLAPGEIYLSSIQLKFALVNIKQYALPFNKFNY